jgi:hypothetical protein
MGARKKKLLKSAARTVATIPGQKPPKNAATITAAEKKKKVGMPSLTTDWRETLSISAVATAAIAIL